MRAVAFCLLEHNSRILLQEFWHEHDGYHFYRPPGGGIEQGERALEAMRRELREELDVELPGLRFLTVLENIFTYGASPKHEIVFLFHAPVQDPRLTDVPELKIIDSMVASRAVWMPVADLVQKKVVLYPEELRLRLPEFLSA